MLIPASFYGLAILTLNAIEIGKCDSCTSRIAKILRESWLNAVNLVGRQSSAVGC